MSAVADYAEVEVEVTVRLRVGVLGTSAVVRRQHHIMPPSLTRAWTAKEVRDGVAPSPWHEGGAAILSPKHATNGQHLVDAARKAADTWVSAL